MIRESRDLHYIHLAARELKKVMPKDTKMYNMDRGKKRSSVSLFAANWIHIKHDD